MGTCLHASVSVFALVVTAGMSAAQLTPNYVVTRLGLSGPGYGATDPVAVGSPRYAGDTRMAVAGQTQFGSVSSELHGWFWSGRVSDPVVRIGPDGQMYRNVNGVLETSVGRPFVLTRTGEWAVAGFTPKYAAGYAGRESWCFDGTTLHTLGLSGPEYSTAAGGATTIVRSTVGGLVAGDTARFAVTGGQASWVWDGSTTQRIGLFSQNYIDGNNYQFSEITYSFASPVVIAGYSRVESQSGYDAWYWKPSPGGGLPGVMRGPLYLNGARYRSWNQSRFSLIRACLPDGRLIGNTEKFGTDGYNSAGLDLWIDNGVTTTPIVTGEGWNYLLAFNPSGSVLIGNAFSQAPALYNPDLTPGATRAWEVRNGVYRLLGLSGPAYSVGTYTVHRTVGVSDAGLVVGYSDRYVNGNTNGRDAWLWNGTNYTVLGLMGPEWTNSQNGTRSSQAYIAADGTVFGTSQRYTAWGEANGTATWLFDGAACVPVGVVGPANIGLNGRTYMSPVSGFGGSVVFGLSERTASGASGNDGWVRTATGHLPLGLTSPEHTSSTGGRQTFFPLRMQNGVMVGLQENYPTYGRDAWYFDRVQERTLQVGPLGQGYTNLISLRDDGLLLGSNNLGGFIFRPDIGFVLLKDLVNGGIAAAGLTDVTFPQAAYGMDRFIAYGKRSSQPITVPIAVTFNSDCPLGESCCDDVDFNNNAVFPEDQDVIDFFNVLAGVECPLCGDIDFNNNGVFPEDQDVIDFLHVLAGGAC